MMLREVMTELAARRKHLGLLQELADLGYRFPIEIIAELRAEADS